MQKDCGLAADVQIVVRLKYPAEERSCQIFTFLKLVSLNDQRQSMSSKVAHLNMLLPQLLFILSEALLQEMKQNLDWVDGLGLWVKQKHNVWDSAAFVF